MKQTKRKRGWRYLTLSSYPDMETDAEKFWFWVVTAIILFLGWLALALGDCI